MYRKLMMLLAVVAVLGLAIGLVGCPQEQTGPPPGQTPMRTGPPRSVREEVKEQEKAEEEATGEEAPAEDAPAEEATGE